jgi:hypothetical protein
VANTNSIVTVAPKHGGIKGHNIAAWSFLVQTNIGDSYQLCWSGNDTDIALETISAPSVLIPVSPSVILSVSQV